MFYMIFWIRYTALKKIRINDFLFWSISYIIFLAADYHSQIGVYSYQASHCFFIGILCARYEGKVKKWLESKAFIRIGIVLFSVGYIVHLVLSYALLWKYTGGIFIYVKILVTMVNCVTFLVPVACFCERLKGVHKGCLDLIGAASLEIYLYHMLWISLIGGNAMRHVCIIMTGAILTALCMYHIDALIVRKSLRKLNVK